MKKRSYVEELNDELEAFGRDLAKLSKRVEEIDNDVYHSGGSMSFGFLKALRIAKDHIDSAWRSTQYAQASVTGN